jgi:predicted lipid-binding transport protein (Tim44 family)
MRNRGIDLLCVAFRRPWLLRLAVCAGLLVAASIALARPGGGGSFSGSGHGGGGGGGGDDDFILDLVFFGLQLCFNYPAIGIPLIVLAIVLFAVRVGLANVRHTNAGWSTAATGDAASAAALVRVGSTPRAALDAIRNFDEDFSVVLFEDFLYALYAEAHYARGKGQLDRLSAYLSPAARGHLGGTAGEEVKTVVIGAMRYVKVEGVAEGAPEIRVIVEFEANYTESAAGREQGYYVREMWRLMRRRTARSRPPQKSRVFNCPNCGAPLDAVIAGECSHCGKQVATGDFDWVVEGAFLQDRQTRGPMLTSGVLSTGMSLPTIVDSSAAERLSDLSRRDAGFSWASFRARLDLIFREFQVAWSARDLAAMRPFLSDRLFEEQRYWVDAFLQQHLRNVTGNARIVRTQAARITSDKYYDAITVRIFATGLDYTVSDEGKLVAGSRSAERPYSEYWTLIRAESAKGPPRADKKCPNCGAPLKINMAGVCEYCQAKVTSGEFDWVLSRIEQADVYTG